MGRGYFIFVIVATLNEAGSLEGGHSISCALHFVAGVTLLLVDMAVDKLVWCVISASLNLTIKLYTALVVFISPPPALAGSRRNLPVYWVARPRDGLDASDYLC